MLPGRVALLAFAGLLLTACGEDPCDGVKGRCVGFREGTPEKTIQEALVSATADTTFAFGTGTFTFENALLLEGAAGVTVKGAGAEKTVLDFKGQKAGSEAVSADHTDRFTISDVHVRDAKGDGIKVLGSTGVRFQRVRVTWTGPNPTEHGAYGLYPVQCQQVLIEDSFVSGASDAGIYVGQSKDIVVRRSEATQNVAGIEIENSHRADVYENKAHGNTGGILVFGLPGLQQPDGHTVRVFKNDIRDNNTPNFAPQGNIVGTVARGTGVLLMANHDVEVFDNTLTGNKTVSVAIVNYLLVDQNPEDPRFSPSIWKVHVHDNTFSGGGAEPDPANIFGQALGLIAQALPTKKVPDVVYDGIPGMEATGRLPGNPMEVCVGSASSFVNLHADQADQNGAWTEVSFDVAPYACNLPALPAVSFPGL